MVHVFGNASQQKMQRTAHWLWPLLNQDPKYGYEGRMIGIDAPSREHFPALLSLAWVQGASVSHFVPAEQDATISAYFADAGMETDRWNQMEGGRSVIEACREKVRSYELPGSYRIVEVSADASGELLAGFSETALSCGVLPPALPTLTSQSRNGVAFLAMAPDGGVAACSGAVMRNHRDSELGDASWWGMLATRDADRGQGLSMYLGALAALAMHERHGAQRFYTGVRADNDVSRHLCERLGLAYEGNIDLAILDPAAFAGSGYTK